MENKYRQGLDSVILHTIETWKVYAGMTNEKVYLSEIIEKAKGWYDEKHKELVYQQYDSETYRKIPLYYDMMYNHAMNNVRKYFTEKVKL